MADNESGRAEVEVGTSGRFVLFEGWLVTFEGREIGSLTPEANDFEETYRFEAPDQPVQSLVGTLEDARWMIVEDVRKDLIAAGELPGREHEPWRVAIHEAGHAVAAVKLRTGLRKATITEDDESHGRVTGATLLRGKGNNATPEQFPQDRIERQIVGLLAGYAAEQKEFGRAAEFDGAEHDYQSAFRLAGVFVGSQDECDDYIGLLSVRTTRFVEDHWGEIEAVARALVLDKELNRSQVVKLIQESTP